MQRQLSEEDYKLFFQETRVDSHIHTVTSTTPVPRGPGASLAFLNTRHAHWTQTHVQAKYWHTKLFLKYLFKAGLIVNVFVFWSNPLIESHSV